jgi:hypothetical protein
MSSVGLLRRCGVAVAVAIAVCVAAGAATKTTAPPEQKQREKLSELVDRLSRHQPASTEWLAAAEQILALGEIGRERLGPILRARMGALDRAYQSAFVLSAKRLRVARFNGAAEREGKTPLQLVRDAHDARRTVLMLTAKSDLSEADLSREGDPAMKRLAELHTVTRQAVLDADEKLRPQRDRLLKLWALRARCDDGEADAAGARADGDERLTRAEEVGAFLATPMDSYAARTIQGNGKLAARIRPDEAEGIRDLNRMRVLLGLRALAIDVRLCEAAREHCTDMRTKGFFSHTSPVGGKRTPWDRARRAGTKANAENITAGARTGPQANRMWFHSPGHMKNMFRDFRRVGLGHDGPWTQMFGY